ncbi:permease prefix domain 1-containing protein [Brachybacterium sp. AOP43-C2-M15]|uniref:permease prefix domain 1-containing protein n=1 Tax=Brachybacterium sp. AOP43-C2-M15 TaxID=3457661 RepID=UPI0040335058
MNTELTERYIRATASGLPTAAQEDVRAELAASILDATEARIEQGEDPGIAERAVLTELGDPAILAAEYADRPLHLIGPRHYLAWRRLLTLLLWIVPACAVVGVVIGQVLVQAPVGTVIGQSIAAGLGAVVHVSFWVTVVFMILERTGTETGTAWDLDQLPELEAPTTGRADAIASVALTAIGAGAVLWDQLRGFLRIDGEALAILNPGLWPTWVLALLALLALEAALAVVVVLHRRWTPALAIANTALAVLFLSWALTLIGRSELVNPDFVDLALRANGVDGNALWVITVVGVASLIGVSVWDVVDGWRKARRDTRR